MQLQIKQKTFLPEQANKYVTKLFFWQNFRPKICNFSFEDRRKRSSIAKQIRTPLSVILIQALLTPETTICKYKRTCSRTMHFLPILHYNFTNDYSLAQSDFFFIPLTSYERSLAVQSTFKRRNLWNTRPL